MKSYQIIGIVSMLILIGCATTLDTKIPSYEIEPVEIVNKTDTTYINEFRMMEPKSSSNTFDMMKKNYGKPKATYSGKYQENIDQNVWNNVPLLDNEKLFTIITDGTETSANYYTSMMIFDSDNKDCLTPSHKDRKALVEVITYKMGRYVKASR